MPSKHHLMRVLMHEKVFEKLKSIADVETEQTGNYVSASALVRSAILDWIETYEASQRLAGLRPGRMEIQPPPSP